MKKRNAFKLLSTLVLLVGVVIGSTYFILAPKQPGDKTVNVTEKLFGWKFPVAEFPATGSINNELLAYSDIRDPGGIPQGLPVRLKIPAIGVDSAIEDALITPDGRMDVPVGSVNVAWFSLGPHPGNVGSAVIGGHFGITNGVPFVFYSLDKLGIGDKVYIEDDRGETLAFVVRSTKSFDRNADSTTVFTSNDGLAHLNLITCEGVWNQINDSYPERLVVFTDAVPTEGAIVVNKQKVATDVAPTLGPTLVPTLTESEPVGEKPLLPDVQMASIKSLYATLTDGLITSGLLVAIGIAALVLRRKYA